MVHIPNVDDNAQNQSTIMIRIMLWVRVQIQVFDYNFFRDVSHTTHEQCVKCHYFGARWSKNSRSSQQLTCQLVKLHVRPDNMASITSWCLSLE